MTEQEARTKWCPNVRVELFGNAVVVNRWEGKREETYRCIASDCMMWRWLKVWGEKTGGYCGLAEKSEEFMRENTLNCKTCGHYELYKMVTSGKPYGYAFDIPCLRCVRFSVCSDEHTAVVSKVCQPEVKPRHKKNSHSCGSCSR